MVTGRERQVVAIGGGVVLSAVLMLRVLPWIVRSAITAEAGLRDRGALLARARADLAEASGLRDSAARLSQALMGLAPHILSGNTAIEAVADVSGRVNLAAADHHATLERVDQVADSAQTGRLHRATLRATLKCDIRGLVGVLQALERGQAALTVKELRVEAVDPGSSETNPEVLRVEMAVTGWFLADAEGRTGKPWRGQ